MARELPVLEEILSANDRVARENRRLLDRHGVVAVNVMAAPGAGKTSLILATIAALDRRLRVGVVEGDVAGRVDADKIATTGMPVVQINTGGGCHLDAPQVAGALERLPLDQIDLLFIENVGNLICPTGFDLGEHRKVLIAHLPEGDDKPIKYPGMFTAVDALVLNKTDLAPYVDFCLAAFQEAFRALNPRAPLFQLSCKTGEGLDAWVAWLEGQG
ncbi:MAG: hydrogenase nickel incorporation protein HypB [Anaerolineae bacterium]|jgi:hydrogenase nickel incorporation protein HypB|nr:hydrogenase nickel incorporation protein HypB [Anaerolineae bacterium]MDX9832590.1 hydrogenase nickel incorporation protein HypB [Anaerolineae bacterium]